MTIPDEFRGRLQSDEFPCPTPNCKGTITLDWGFECDDMGYRVHGTDYPIFAGECQDNDQLAEWMALEEEQSGFTYYRNHAERLNEAAADGQYDSEYIVRILGMSAERKTLRALFERMEKAA